MGAAGYLATTVPLRLASAGSAVALPILAVQRMDDVALGGALVAASLAPAVVAAPLAGVALDRARNPRILFVAAALITVAAFAASALLGTLPLGIIVALLIAAGCAAPVYFGGLSSFATESVPDEKRAYAYDALSYNIASVAGPGLVAIVGLGGAGGGAFGMWLMTLAAAVGAVASFTMRVHPRPETGHGWLGTIAAGARQLAGHARLRLVIVSGTVAAFGSGALPIVAIALAIDRTGDLHQAAVIVTAFAVGGLAGSVIAAIRPAASLTPQLVMGGGWAATGLFTLLAIPDLGMVFTVVVIGISGIFTASSNAAMLLLRKINSPPAVRSQVFTIGSGLRAASGASGAAVAGLIAGLPVWLLVAGIGISWIASAAMVLGYRAQSPAKAPEPTS